MRYIYMYIYIGEHKLKTEEDTNSKKKPQHKTHRNFMNGISMTI